MKGSKLSFLSSFNLKLKKLPIELCEACENVFWAEQRIEVGRRAARFKNRVILGELAFYTFVHDANCFHEKHRLAGSLGFEGSRLPFF